MQQKESERMRIKKSNIVKSILIIISILPVFPVFAVEGVLAEPEFIELELESGEDYITFPSDFEQIFHKPYQNYLQQADSGKIFHAYAEGSSNLDAILGAEYEMQNAFASFDFKRNNHDFFTKDHANLFGNGTFQIGNFPVDGFLELDYFRKRYSLYYPRTANGIGSIRMIMPFQNDVVAFDLDGFGSHRQTNKKFKELAGDFRIMHQHHFGTYFGEEVILRGKYHLQNEGDFPYNKYRLLSSRAGLFLKYGVFLLRLGLKSSGSYSENLTSPFVEFWVDHHSIRASIAYNEEIQSPGYGKISDKRPEVVYPIGMPEEVNRELKVFGSLLIDHDNTIRFDAKLMNSQNHIFPVSSNSDTLYLDNRDANIANARICIETDYDFINNKFAFEYDYSRLTNDGEFLPLRPRFSVIDSFDIPLGNDFSADGYLGYRDGIYRQLQFTAGTEPDYEEAILLGIGLKYQCKKFLFNISADNLAGDIVDYQGFLHPLEIFVGISYQN